MKQIYNVSQCKTNLFLPLKYLYSVKQNPFLYVMDRTMFHTQEKRANRIKGPIKCVRWNAWLGEGWYFWYYEDDAHFWGINSKCRNGSYEIYAADIDDTNVLNTVFDETHYTIWVDAIERAIKTFVKARDGKRITIKRVNDFLKDKGVLDGIDGVMFQDISSNPSSQFVPNFQFRKRIQLVIYDLKIMSNFVFVREGKC
jgi:hypothetical protein